MPHTASVVAYPWGSLERVSRRAARSWRSLAARLSNASVANEVASAFERWLGEPVRIERRGLREMSGEPDGPAYRLRLRLAPGQGEIVVCLDTRLVGRLVAFALNRKPELQDPLARVEPALLGAAAAIVAKIIDDAGLDFGLDFALEPLDLPDAQRLQLDATLHIGTVAYPLVVGVVMKGLPPPEPSTRASGVRALGALDIALPLVVGEARILRDELGRIAPGCALLTGSGLWVNEALEGHGALAAPLAERGVRVKLQPGGKIVLGEGSVPLPHDDSKPSPAPERGGEDLTDTLFEAPVVVRVELASVSLPARQWASLRPGDIVETGQPLGSEVTLRSAGRALALGELLNVDGELGVRITKVLVGEEA